MFAKRTRNFWKAMAQVEQGQDWILALALMAILTFSGFTIRYLKGSTPGTENVTNITVSGSSTSSVAKPTLERNVQAAPHVPPDQNEIHYRVLAQFASTSPAWTTSPRACSSSRARSPRRSPAA